LLSALQDCNLKLYPSKTVIAPTSTSVLGWTWSKGTLKASPHRIATLPSCQPPSTVKELHSFIGAYKVLARVLPRCSYLLASLDDSIVGRESKDRVPWDDNLLHCFHRTQKSLSDNKTIYLPRASDSLWIVTDGATVASDGLLIVKRCDPFVPSKELIVIPRQVLHGTLTAIHISLNHPSCHQLKTLAKRYFFALDMDKAIENITSSCTHCASLRKLPHFLQEQSTCDPPDSIGTSFAADVMKRQKTTNSDCL
jgi:hypothetical protein